MAKIRKDLFGSVLIANPEGGDPIVLVAGDKVPKGIEVGDHVLEPKSKDETDAQKASKGTKGSQAPFEPAGTEGGSHENVTPLTPPPLAGAGSGTDKWRDYAAASAKAKGLQLEIADDASRADIVEALKGAGIATE